MPVVPGSRGVVTVLTTATRDAYDDATLAEIQAALTSGVISIALMDALETPYRNAYGDLERRLSRALREGIKAGATTAALETIATSTEFQAVRFSADRVTAILLRVLNDQRTVLMGYIKAGIRKGYTLRETAALVRSIVGLDSRLARAVVNYRDRLKRDGIASVVANKRAAAYGNRLRLYRARMIAQTEINIARNAGRETVWLAGKRLGLLSAETMRVWVMQDETACEICHALDGTTAAIDGSWTTITGAEVYTAGAAHPHCRCSEELVTR